ncbi:hypothetical protein H2203_005922 [Taxawa tesnikishii (nom. ined.)]|nr:hypothetical protein H2203_005922 [Dothideales sp. JES 119]
MVVFGLLVVEVLAFGAIVWARPFEGQRLNILVVYCLGFSKVTTVALSAAFDISFNLQRITTTVIGIVIIVIQGVLAIITLVAIVVGAISSYMSVTRNRDDFRPKKWAGIRGKYFLHLSKAAHDQPRPPTPEPVVEEPKDPYFSVNSVRRMTKIEDEDPDFVAEMAIQDRDPNQIASYMSLNQRSETPTVDPAIAGESAATHTPVRRSRAASMQSTTNLPFGARVHRPSWSSRDFTEWNEERTLTPINMNRYVPDDEPAAESATPTNKGLRTPSRRATIANPKLRAVGSTDSLRVGGNVSAADNIGNVPSPSVRPRSGTFNGSKVSSRNGTPMQSTSNLATSLDVPGERVSRGPLTPAMERDEELFRSFSRGT